MIVRSVLVRRCCLWVAEKIVKFINKNAYIMVAIKGQGYCTSASRQAQELEA